MTVSQTQTQPKTDEQLIATPILSNRSVPKDLTLESLDRFSLDSPASALTERSNASSGSRQKRTFRFSCPDEEPIIILRSRLTNRDKDSQYRERGGLTRSKSPPNVEGQVRKDRRRRRPSARLSLVSSITTLVTSSNSSKEKGDNKRKRLLVGRTSQLTLARDIMSCWVRDLTIEILSRLNGRTGNFWFFSNNIYHTIFGMNIKRALVPTVRRPLSASQELRIRWNRRKKRRNLSFRKRREQPICVQGLPNQGQTCFLNSVLQSLASLEPFLEYLEGIVEYQEENEHLYFSSNLSQEASQTTPVGGYRRLLFGTHDGKNELYTNFVASSFSRELLDLLKGINSVEDGIPDEKNEKDGAPSLIRGRRLSRKKTLNPKTLLHKIAKTNPQFSSYEQQDAQELFASLMEVVIHDSQLDTSSSDHRIEVPSCVTGNRNEIGAHSKNPISIGGSHGSSFESDGSDGPMTSAFAHSNGKIKELAPRKPCQYGNGEPLPKLIDANQISTKVAWKDENEYDDEDETNILSLSSLLMRISNEQNRFLAESNQCSLALKTTKNSYEEHQAYQNGFLEEKKQECCDASGNTTLIKENSDICRIHLRSGRKEQKCQQGLFSHDFPRPEFSFSSEKRRIRNTMSPITPSPLSGWLGSTLQCSRCKHVRPIQNAPFLDIPLVPTSVPNYLSRVYQNSTTKPASPNSSPLPSCSLEACLEIFTGVESVDDVECRSCTIRTEIDRLEEEAMMLKGAIATTQRRILNKTKGSTNTNDTDTRELESLEETKCLREELLKVQTRLIELEAEDPDQDDDIYPSRDVDNSEEEDFFFGDMDPRDKTPMQRCKAKKCLILTRTPSVLCFFLQRRYYNPFNSRMEKCIQFVEFPLFLDLSPYCAYGPLAKTSWIAGSCKTPTDLPKEPSQARNPKLQSTTHGKRGSIPYQLQSVIEHRGNAFGGHYVSYRRDHTGSWFCISDRLVTPVSWREVQTCQAYMLFYESL